MNLESVWRCTGAAVFLVAAACASGPRADAANAPPLETARPDAGAASEREPETPATSPATNDADAGAEETPKDCNFRVKGFCFKTDEEACAAAGCDAAKCMILESYPARVKCRE